MGQQLRSKNQRITNKYGELATPINRVLLEFSCGDLSKDHSAKQKLIQFPLKLSWAITTHKIQGQTFKDPKAVGLDLKTTFGVGKYAQAYVMLGRTENLDQLYIADFDNDRLGVQQPTLKQPYTPEMESKSLDKRAKRNEKANAWLSMEGIFRLSALNISSLNCHFQDLSVDSHLLKSDVLAISETWYSKDYSPPVLDGYQGLHVMVGRGRGISLFVRDELKQKKAPKIIDLPSMQMIRVKIRSLTIILVYRSPSIDSYNQFREELLSIIPPKGSTIVCGDFNIHPNTKENQYESLINVMAAQGFQQLVDKPTHIKGNILDHLYVRDLENPSWKFHHPYYSDHDAICFWAKL